MRSLFRAALLAAAPLSVSLSAQDASAPGFSLTPAPFPGAPAFGTTTTLSNGHLVVFDGLDLFQYAGDGTLLHHLGSLEAWVFPSFVVADPDENALYVGESSTGAIYRFFTGQHASPDLTAVLPLNYDAAVFDGHALFVSAATCGFQCGNEIWRVDLGNLQLRLVARVPGASGPLVFDGQGNLYYGTSPAAFPPPPKPTRIYRWTAAALASPQVLSLADGQLVGAGFEGAARLAFDRRVGALYLVENNFLSGSNRIRRVLGAPEQSPILVEGQPFRSIGNLSFQAGSGPAHFRAFQPPSDAHLSYTTSDFVAPPERFVLQPRRPSASFEGPGTSGPGPSVLRLQDGPPSGYARVLLGPAASFHSPERVRLSAGLPLFLGVDPLFGSAKSSGRELYQLDASGALELGFPDPGGLAGQRAAQLLLFDAERRVAGTSGAAFL
jgi:hypothetical protein